MRVFISYAHEDVDHVQPYVERLQREPGIELFWDQGMEGGDDWPKLLASRATGANALIIFVSQSACDSEYATAEVVMAKRRGSRIIPVQLEPIEGDAATSGLVLLLASTQAVLEYERGFEESYRSLIAGLRSSAKGGKEATIIAVMGVQGGVGKSTVVSAMAELIASRGANVVLIDADIETGGLTTYLRARARRQPNVWTMLDAAYARMPTGTTQGHVDRGLWEVTPRYLMDERFGRVYLIPGRLASDHRLGYEPLANIPEGSRNSAALEILEEALSRARELPVPVQCVIVDCGAENNPLVSAGFVLCNYGFLVARPNPEFAAGIGRFDAMHRQRYPQHDLRAMNVIVNQARAATPALWEHVPGVTFLPDDPTMRLASTLGTYDFEGIGLNDFFVALQRVLQEKFDSEDQQLLPDEVDVWVRPRIKQIAERRIPQRLLAGFWFRAQRLLGFALPLLGLLLAGVSGHRSYDLAREALAVAPRRVAVIELDRRQDALSIKERLDKGAEFWELAKQRSASPNAKSTGGAVSEPIVPGDPVPGVGYLEGLAESLRRTREGSVCDRVFSREDRFYLVKVLDVVDTSDPPATRRAAHYAAAAGIVIGVALTATGAWHLRRFRRRRRLLMEVVQRGPDDKVFLEKLLRSSPEKGELRWLRRLLNDALEDVL